MKIKCLLKGHLPAFDPGLEYFQCARCGKVLVEQTMGNTKTGPRPDKYLYEKRCRFCDVAFGDRDTCPKCETILYHWIRIGKRIKHPKSCMGLPASNLYRNTLKVEEEK